MSNEKRICILESRFSSDDPYRWDFNFPCENSETAKAWLNRWQDKPLKWFRLPNSRHEYARVVYKGGNVLTYRLRDYDMVTQGDLKG